VTIPNTQNETAPTLADLAAEDGLNGAAQAEALKPAANEAGMAARDTRNRRKPTSTPTGPTRCGTRVPLGATKVARTGLYPL
jgi:hypothetical protein